MGEPTSSEYHRDKLSYPRELLSVTAQGYFVAEKGEAAYRGLDRATPAGEAELQRFAELAGLVEEDWLSITLTDALALHRILSEIHPESGYELMWVAHLNDIDLAK